LFDNLNLEAMSHVWLQPDDASHVFGEAETPAKVDGHPSQGVNRDVQWHEQGDCTRFHVVVHLGCPDRLFQPGDFNAEVERKELYTVTH
jgi:hypothetical protein